MHTYKLNHILDFKVMGHNGYDQTACLAGAVHYAAKGHSRDQRTRRHLTKKRKRTDKNDENRKDSTENFLQMLWNFYSSKSIIFKEFSNKNQLIWILNAKVMAKKNLLSLEIARK